MSSNSTGRQRKQETFVDFDAIDSRTGHEMDDLEHRWFAAYHAAEAIRAELQIVGAGLIDSGVLANVLARLEEAECRKHAIMRRINALEDSLIDMD